MGISRITLLLPVLFLAVCCGRGEGKAWGKEVNKDSAEAGKTELTAEMLPTPKGAAVTQYEGMTLVWHDEFDTDGPLSDEWSYEEGFQRNEELQWYRKENASVSGGTLVIEGRQETVPNPNFISGSQDWRTNRPSAQYTSSCVTTRESFSFRYGRLEVRAKIPVDQGAWPAIWTLGNTWNWPFNGEIDVMEFYIRSYPGILANACWGGRSTFDAVWDDSITPFTHFTDKDPQWASKYHIWRLDWDKDWLKFYLDGELLNDVELSKTVNGEGGPGKGQSPFSNDVEGFGHYILLNLAIGSNGGDPSMTKFPLQYFVDYVRVYQ